MTTMCNNLNTFYPISQISRSQLDEYKYEFYYFSLFFFFFVLFKRQQHEPYFYRNLYKLNSFFNSQKYFMCERAIDMQLSEACMVEAIHIIYN